LFSNVFCRFGMPSYLISDRGPNYTSRLMQALCKLCHIQQSFSTAYHHETAGRAEQFISSILKTFRMYCNSNNDWSSKIDAVLLSYRALKTTITNLSPFEVLFSQQMRLPIDTSVLKELDVSPDVDTYVQKMLKKIELTREIAKSAHHDANERSKFFYDRDAAYPQYDIGQKVLLYDETTKVGENRKTKRRYAGPYFIEKVLPNYNFELRHCQTGSLMRTPVHSNRLRPFKDDRTRFHGIAPRQTITQPNAAVPSVPTSALEPSTDDSWYEIVKLSKKKKVGDTVYYYVLWKDNNTKTWEPATNITQQAIDVFEASLKSRKRKKRKRQS